MTGQGSSGPDARPQTVDEIADALADDPVLVDPMFGNGRTDQVREALGEIVDEVDFPAYVVLAPAPDGLSANDPERELATLLHQRLGGDGVFHVHLDPTGHASEVAGFGDVPDVMMRYRVMDELKPGGGFDAELSPAGIAARDLELLDSGGDITADELDAYTQETLWRDPPEWDLDYDAPEPGAYSAFMTMAFVVTAGCVWLLLRNLARWRQTARPAKAQKAGQSLKKTKAAAAASPARRGETPEQVRAQAERELDGLAERLRSTAGWPLPDRTRELVDGSYDTARGVLERTGTSAEELDDLVGALVLARVASRALAQGRRAEKPYRPCFFDPRHGEAERSRSVPVGDRHLDVPVCRACGAAGDGTLEPMLVPGGLLGRDRPWYEHDTVWARTGYGAFADDLWHHVATEQREAR